MHHILLLLDHKENRRLLAEWLGHKYHVILDGEQALDEPFDLGILDGPALDRLWERVQARKEAEQPVLLPFLLVTARKDVRYVTRHLWRTVDELIMTPLEKMELQTRVEALLQTRQLSLELHQRYRRLFENVPLGLYRTTPDGCFLEANAALAQMLGYPNREALMAIKSTDLYVDPQDRQRWQKLMERQGAVRHFETQLYRRDKAVIWVENNAQVVRDAEGHVLYYEGSLQDITDRKRAEEALRESEEWYQLLLSSITDGCWVLDSEWRYKLVNEAGARLVNMVPDQLVGHKLTDLFPGIEKTEFFAAYDRSMRERTTESVAGPFAFPDGRMGVYEVHVYPVPDGILCIGRDITERKRTKEALRLRMEQLIALSQAAQSVTSSLELDQVLTEIVSLAREVSGADYVSVALMDEAGHMSQSIEDVQGVPSLELRIRDKGFTSWIVRSRQAIIVDEIGEDGTVSPDLGEGAPRTANPHLVKAGIKSVVGLPLLAKDRLLGVLYLHSLRPRAFQGQLDVLTTFANQAAIAIENARLYQESQRRAEEMAALREVSLATLSTLERDQVFEIMLDQLGKVIDYDTAAIKVITPDGRDKMIAGRGPIIHDQIMWNGFDVKDNKLVQEMRETEQAVVVHDTHTDERFEKIGNWEAFHSWAGAPLFVKGDLIGYLAVEKTSPGFYDEHAIQLLDDFARAAALALENAKLYEDIRRELAERKRAEEALRRRDAILNAVAFAAEQLLKGVDFDESVNAALARLGEATAVSRVYIFENHVDEHGTLLTSQRYEWVAPGITRQIDNPELQNFPWVEGGFERWLETLSKNEVLYGLVRDFPESERLILEAQGIISIAIVPIFVAGEWWGFIGFDDCLTERHWSSAEIEALRAAADALGAAIQRRRAEEALRNAEARYRTLVEQLPAIIYIVESGEVTRTIYISPQVESLLGFSQAEWLADPELWIKQIHPDDRERVVAEVRRKDAEGEPLDLEYRVLTRDGRVLWFRNRTALVRDETGRIRYSQGVMFDITERKRAEKALQRRLDELTVLQAIATAGTEAADEDELIKRATQIIGETLQPDNLGVILLDEGSGLLRPHPSHWLRASGEALTLRLGEGIVGQVALSGRPRRVPDVRLDPDYVEGNPQTRSELCVPLKVGKRVIGVINTESTELDAYSEDDERLLTTVASQLATAIEKVRLFEQMEQRALEMTSLYTISLRLATAGELNELLQTIVEQAVVLLRANGGGLYLYDQATDELELAVVHGIVLEEDLGIRLKPGEGLSGKVMQKRQPMVVDDYRTWEGRSSKYEGRPYTAVAAVPLLWRGQLIGVLDVTDDKERHTFNDNDVRLLTLLAQQAAAAIANTRLFEETRRLQEFSQNIIQSMAEGIVIEDAEGVITFVNPAAAEMLGYKPEELVGQHWTVTVPPDQQPLIEAANERRKRGEADRYEVELVRKDGTRLSALVSGLPRFENNRFVGTMAVFTDITERKRAEEELRQSHARLRRTLERTIQVVISTIEMRDPYTAGHQRRVTQLACAIARELGLPEEEIEGLRMAALVHDLGKISVPAEILSKPGRLNPIEWTMIKAHPQIGYEVLKAVEFPWPVAETVLQHHERLDGSGYPQGLSGKDILMKARILAVADVVEAMSSHRPYRPAPGIDKALEEIERNKGILYDPEVVDACVRLFTKKGFKFEE